MNQDTLVGNAVNAPVAPGDGRTGTGSSRRHTGLGWRILRGYTLLIAFIVTLAVFSAVRPSIFPTTANAKSILTGNAALVLISLAAMIPLIVNQFDLTPAYMATMAGLFVAGFQSFDGLPFWLAIVLTIVIGMLFGAANGIAVAYLGLSSIIVTIGSGALLLGAAELYSNNLVIFNGIAPGFTDLGQRTFIGLPLPIVYAAVIALALWYILSYRPVGRFLYAIGANTDAARLVKIRVNILVVAAFVASGTLASLGGIVATAQAGSASPSSLNYLLLPAFTAVFLGATSIRPGHYNVWGTVLAVYLVGALTTGLFMLGAPPNIAQVLQGSILLIAVGLAKLSSKRLEKATLKARRLVQRDDQHAAEPTAAQEPGT
jgi:ribose transport system permease protein